jgi:hypothetical protein
VITTSAPFEYEDARPSRCETGILKYPDASVLAPVIA